jgi:hypothetical protein
MGSFGPIWPRAIANLNGLLHNHCHWPPRQTCPSLPGWIRRCGVNATRAKAETA